MSDHKTETALWHFARDHGRRLLDVLLPPLPLLPPRPLLPQNDDGATSGEGWAALAFLDEPCCQLCGFPFEYGVSLVSLCAQCLVRRPVFHACRSAFVYDDASRSLVLAFKHGGRTEALPMFGAQMARAGRKILDEADVLLPVPLHKRRLIQRRYNQAAILAAQLSRQTDLAVDAHSLLRIRATQSQGGQTAQGRRRNVKGAFALSPKATIAGRHVVLIDDVYTTGATLEACARTLLAGGAARVSALTLARVVRRALPRDTRL